jgi:hypothetical protein
MSHEQFIFCYKDFALSYLISIPKAVSMLLAHKVRDARFQLVMVKWTCALIAVLSAAICAFNLVPMFLAVAIFADGISLFALLFWLGTGDIFLEFVLEDEWFFELAIGCHALRIFEDTELSLPQPGK